LSSWAAQSCFCRDIAGSSYNESRLVAPIELDHLCVVLVNTRNPLNIGAAARAMSNFGFFDLRLVSPYQASFREARSAVGASEVLGTAREYKSVAEAVADCTLVVGTTAAARRELQHPLRRLGEGAKIIRKHLARGRAAILFGSEKRGLVNDDLSHCHWLLRIPTRVEHGSMNLGQAVAVCLYELVRAGKQAKPAGKTKLASSDEMERITTLLLEALRLSGYLGVPGKGAFGAASTKEKLRRTVRRLSLSAADAELLLGMLRQMLWKMRATD
jgi:TrmH family RNA methyltransferase